MKLVTILFCTFFTICFSTAQQKSSKITKDPGIEKTINSYWTFNYFPKESADKGYESRGFDDSKWPAISLPHTWNTYETTGEFKPYTKIEEDSDNTYWWIGWGWYRKHFTLTSDLTGKKVFLEFEGVQNYSKVWFNGNFLGEHKGGNSKFGFDISGFIKQGEDNVVAVAVNNRQPEILILPVSTEDKYNFYGGIYRDVSIIIKNKLYIPRQGNPNQEGGTFITTPKVSDKESLVRIQTWVKNENAEKKNTSLQTSIFDATGKVVQVIKTEAVIPPGQLYMFDQISKPISNPHLWFVKDPYLYSITTELLEGKLISDSYSSQFGIRKSGWDNNSNLLNLNGEKITGNAGYYDIEYPWLGNSIPKWITIRDITEIAGNRKFSYLIINNYPNYKEIIGSADKLGIIIEADFSVTENQQITVEQQQQQVKAIIRNYRNHPSILFWNTGNTGTKSIDAKTVYAEDTTRIVNGHLVRNARISDGYPGANEKPDNLSKENSTGEAAKISVNVSHKSITADRGSVVIINAEIVDSKGNRIVHPANSITWKVSGPATLVGPAIYESDINKPDEKEIMHYSQMPVSNMIRSTGKSGNIRVRVSATGLASGFADIEVVDPKPENSVILEPVLKGEGRLPVTRKKLTSSRLESIPIEIKSTTNDFNLPGQDKKAYSRTMREYVFKNNTTIDTSSVEFRTLIDVFASHLIKNEGRLIADDYNYTVDHYNNCRLITGYITSTKLPPLFKETLKKYYAYSIINRGNEKNAGDEMNWLNWIPSGGTVVVSGDKNLAGFPKGTIITSLTDLSDIINQVYPVFKSFSPDAKERALTFISKMNPYIIEKTNGNTNGADPNNEIESKSYEAEKGKPVLIPLLKFIAE